MKKFKKLIANFMAIITVFAYFTPCSTASNNEKTSSSVVSEITANKKTNQNTKVKTSCAKKHPYLATGVAVGLNVLVFTIGLKYLDSWLFYKDFEQPAHELIKQHPNQAANIEEQLILDEKLNSFKGWLSDTTPTTHSTALIVAAKKGKHKDIETLLKRWDCTKSTINIHDTDGHTALMYAIAGCKFDIVKKLIEKGASLTNDDEEFDYNYLAFASRRLFVRMAQSVERHVMSNVGSESYDNLENEFRNFAYLLDKFKENGFSANSTAMNNLGHILTCAVANNYLFAIPSLVSIGANVNLIDRDFNNKTALEIATEQNNITAVQALLVNKGITDENKERARQIAREHHYREIIDLLRLL